MKLLSAEKFKTAVCIDKENIVFVVLYDRNDRPKRKVWVYPDGRITFRDFDAPPSKSQEYVLLRPIER